MNYHYVCKFYLGLLVLATSAFADIVWSGEQNLPGSGQLLDLNSDSVMDVWILYDASGDASGKDGVLYAYVDGFVLNGSSRVLVSNTGYDALPFGTEISGSPSPSYEWGSGSFFAGRISEWSTHPPTISDDWAGLLGENGNAYVGVEFKAEGATHYGWLNIALGSDVGPEGFKDPIVTSWAYESMPGVGIIAGAIPEPSTGLLTVGGSLALLMLARSRLRR